MVSINVLVVYTNNYISYFFAFKFRKVCHGNDLLAPTSKVQPARSVKSLVLIGRRSNKFSERKKLAQSLLVITLPPHGTVNLR